jgi:hypothetical protein
MSTPPGGAGSLRSRRRFPTARSPYGLQRRVVLCSTSHDLRTLGRLTLLLTLALLAAVPATALGAADNVQFPEQLNQPGTTLNGSYTRTDSNVGSTGDTFHCNSINYTDDVWYQIHPQSNGVVAFQAFSNDFFPVVTLWAVNNGNLGALPNGNTPCNTASPATRTAFAGGIPVEAGKTYDVQVGIQCITNNDCTQQQVGGVYTFSLGYDPDTDGDGVLDSVDVCRTTPGPAANGGCPPDDDHDGVPNALDRCPANPGSPTAGGCPVLGALIGQNFASLTRIRQLYVTQVKKGTTVRAFCHGNGCFPEHKVRARRNKGKIVLVKNWTVKRGDVITITATSPGSIGKYRRIRIRRGSAPTVGDILCLQPGSSKPSRCPS